MHPNDMNRWQAKVDQIEAAAGVDATVQAEWAELDAVRDKRCAELRELLNQLSAGRDFAEFRRGVDLWSRQPGPFKAFAGQGQMWLNIVSNNLPDDPATLDLLIRALSTPSSIEGAQQRFAEVEDLTRDLASRGRPAVGNIPFVLSLFWSTDTAADPQWPCLWPSAPKQMYDLGWVRSWTNADRYEAFLTAARALCADDVHRFDRDLWFLATRETFVGINPGLELSCEEASALLREAASSGYVNESDASRAESLAGQLKGELNLAAAGLHEELKQITGFDLEVSKPTSRIAFSKDAPFRADAYAAWSMPGGMSSPGFRLWATQSGVAFGVYGGWTDGGKDSATVIAERMAAKLPPGAQFFEVRAHKTGDRLEPVASYPGGEAFVGHRWSWDELPEGTALRPAILKAAQAMTPMLKALGTESSTDQSSKDSAPDPELIAAVAQFKAERPYPNEKDPWHEEQRVAFADALSAENLTVFDLDLFRLLINAKRYGNPGPQAVLNTSLSAMDSVQLDEFASRLREILWGDADPGSRIDRGLDWDDLGTKGLGESVLLKLFAIIEPERYLPTFPIGGPRGKIAMLRRLELPEPDSTLSRGQQQVIANDTLRKALEPLMPNDPWGQGQFAFWLLTSGEIVVPPDVDLLADAAESLLVDEGFLREIDELLQEKGQLIFYGPPGTGKTYIADKFAAALQPDPERRMLVQFHPSMSYEDFFEGYRPRTDERGQLTYELRPGPLALMAEKAESAPGVPHVLIIDEINRANLPRVFGELLFLLEYRNKSVRTAYRPDEPFELPKNLFIIGTMNTADRSIAMVDAAMRRRFHFIPFMPHEGAMAPLLGAWLAKHKEPAWVATLVDQVNSRLRTLLKGPHLQVGHSHFMVSKQTGGATVLTEGRLRRIWEYDIYPFIEDQLYGRPNELAEFSWAKVYANFGPSSASGTDAQAEQALAETESDEPAH